MVYYTVVPGSRPEDDMLVYVENDEETLAVTNSIPRVLEDDAGENPAEISEIQIIEPTDSTVIIPEVFVIVDDAEQSENQFNESIGFSFENATVCPNNITRVSLYRCGLCKQIKKGHNCPKKNNSNLTVVDVLEEPLFDESSEVQMIEPTESTRRITDIPSENDVTIARTRTASNRENLSRLAQRVEGDESSDPDWTNTTLMRTKRRRIASTSSDQLEDRHLNKKRKPNRCSYCGAISKGHKVNRNQCPKKLMDEQTRQLSGTPRVIIRKM